MFQKYGFSSHTGIIGVEVLMETWASKVFLHTGYCEYSVCEEKMEALSKIIGNTPGNEK